MPINVSEREPGDVAELRQRVRTESNALQRDHYRAVVLALESEEAVAIARCVQRPGVLHGRAAPW